MAITTISPYSWAKHLARALGRAAVLVVILNSPAAAADDSIPVAHFAAPQGIMAAELSPSGKLMALTMYYGESSEITILNAVTLELVSRIGSKCFQDGHYIMESDPQSLIWLNEDLVAVNYGKGAYSVRLSANDSYEYVLRCFSQRTVAKLGERVIASIGDDGNGPSVLTYIDLDNRKVAHINAENGSTSRIRFSVSGTPIKIAYDRQHQPRAVTVIDSSFWNDATTVQNWYRPSVSAPWQKIAEFKASADYWTPMYVPDEEDRLVIMSREARDTYAIFEFDTKKQATTEMYAGHPTQDIVGVVGLEKPAFSRVTTAGMKPQQIWFDPQWAGLQKAVDDALPGKINILQGNPQTRLAILSYSDVDPGTWYLLDVDKMALRSFGRQRNAIKPEAMRPKQSIAYLATDGLTIPAYLTLPKEKSGPLPLVVMIHGGPWIRDEWDWDIEVQFLASRGYAVLQPQFRGSAGFGKAFEYAGFGQWGRAMQDDITAGVEHLVRTGLADSKRICIYGSSYGGYAAMWGLVKTPDLYRCGISFAGVSDLELMMHDTSDRNKNKAVKETIRMRVGDVKLDRLQFAQVSPLRNAAQIKAPVLLMHGKEDQRVPIIHSMRMLAALKESGKQVEWVEFQDEGHGLSYVRSRERQLQAIEAFLARHIGP